MIMSELTKTRKIFSTRVVGTDTVDGVPCTVDARKSFLSGCRYEVLLDTPGKSDEPRLVAAGTFPEALSALKRDDGTKACAGLLKAVSLSLGDPDSDLTRRFTGSELSVLALLVASEMTAARMADILRMPESTVELTLAQLRSDGIVWRKSAKADASRPYVMSETGRRMCELMKEDERFVEAARRILEAGRG